VFEPKQDTDEGGLARAVEADQGDDLALRNCKIHVLKDDPPTRGKADAARFNQDLGAGGLGGRGVRHLKQGLVGFVYTGRTLYHGGSFDDPNLWRFRMMRFGALAALLLVAMLSACRPLAAAPEVVVTIKPVHALAAGVMAGVGEPALLMDGMASPHTYQMRPSDAAMLSGADLVIWVAPTVESTVPGTLGMLPTDVRAVELVAAPGVRLLPMRESGIRIPAGESDDPHAEESHDHDREGPDPHIWLDPANAMAITEVLVAELSLIDPDHATVYAANGAAQIDRLRSLDAELRARLAPATNAPFITFHDAFQYFEAAYGLRNVASIAISPERAPGGRTVMELRHAIEENEVACVFAEPQFEPQLIGPLIEGTSARAGTLDPLGENVPPGPDAYDAIMRGLAADVLSCFSGSNAE